MWSSTPPVRVLRSAPHNWLYLWLRRSTDRAINISIKAGLFGFLPGCRHRHVLYPLGTPAHAINQRIPRFCYELERTLQRIRTEHLFFSTTNNRFFSKRFPTSNNLAIYRHCSCEVSLRFSSKLHLCKNRWCFDRELFTACNHHYSLFLRVWLIACPLAWLHCCWRQSGRDEMRQPLVTWSRKCKSAACVAGCVFNETWSSTVDVKWIM